MAVQITVALNFFPRLSSLQKKEGAQREEKPIDEIFKNFSFLPKKISHVISICESRKRPARVSQTVKFAKASTG